MRQEPAHQPTLKVTESQIVSQFSSGARDLHRLAQHEAEYHQTMTPAHFLVALLKYDDTVSAARLLRGSGLNLADARGVLVAMIYQVADEDPISQSFTRMLYEADALVRQAGRSLISKYVLAVAIMLADDPIVAEILRRANLSSSDVLQALGVR